MLVSIAVAQGGVHTSTSGTVAAAHFGNSAGDLLRELCIGSCRRAGGWCSEWLSQARSRRLARVAISLAVHCMDASADNIPAWLAAAYAPSLESLCFKKLPCSGEVLFKEGNPTATEYSGDRTIWLEPGS
jgi:hypothetical protein